VEASFGSIAVRKDGGKGFTQDCKKYFTAMCMGWLVLRFTGDMIDERHLKPIMRLSRSRKKVLTRKRRPLRWAA
jgi:hypothetical protein